MLDRQPLQYIVRLSHLVFVSLAMTVQKYGRVNVRMAGKSFAEYQTSQEVKVPAATASIRGKARQEI